jgi:hypothetical protein
VDEGRDRLHRPAVVGETSKGKRKGRVLEK